MRTVRTVAGLRAALAPERRAGRTIGLVPTMGALHEGHLSLIRAARDASDVVVVSLFVNPAQFDDGADLAAYPRTEEQDAAAAASAGADLLFAPASDEVYPAGFATTVSVAGPLTETLEGAHRGAAHFHGVTTVVTKLLNMVQPDIAFFGRKDAQQAVVIQRLVRDLDLPVRVELCPTVREPDGLALSSRNAHLGAGEREQALALSRALRSVAAAIARGTLSGGDAVRAAGLAALREHGAEPEYFEVVDPATLAPAARLDRDLLLVTAARVGRVRLIDNLPVAPMSQILDVDAEVATLRA
ncbi:MAG TPA: pantoate--beta-alanine ligase [Solirubrobacteraceae bacterium]